MATKSCLQKIVSWRRSLCQSELQRKHRPEPKYTCSDIYVSHLVLNGFPEVANSLCRCNLREEVAADMTVKCVPAHVKRETDGGLNHAFTLISKQRTFGSKELCAPCVNECDVCLGFKFPYRPGHHPKYKQVRKIETRAF